MQTTFKENIKNLMLKNIDYLVKNSSIKFVQIQTMLKVNGFISSTTIWILNI